MIFSSVIPERHIRIVRNTTTQPVEPDTNPTDDICFDIQGNHLDFRHNARVRNLVPWFVSIADDEQWKYRIREKSLFTDEEGAGMKINGERKYFFKFPGTSAELTAYENVTNDSDFNVMSQNLEFREGASVKGLVFNFVSINAISEFSKLPQMSLFYDEQGFGFKKELDRKYFSIKE